MGKFKEISMTIEDCIKSLFILLIIYMVIAVAIRIYALNVENTHLKERITLIEQDRTELMRDIKELQDKNKALKSVVETYKIPNNLDTRQE